MKKIFTSVAVIGATMAAAQVGINTETPKATLDVTAKTTDGTKPEGIIAPRLTGDQIKAADAQYLAAQTGTIVYATSASADAGVAAAKTTNITAEGYYYFDGAIWQKFNSGAAAGTEPWYDVATNTGATANTQDIYQMGNVGVGTNAPTAKLHVVDTATTDAKTAFKSFLNLNQTGSITTAQRAVTGFLDILSTSTANYDNSGNPAAGSFVYRNSGTGNVNYSSGILQRSEINNGATQNTAYGFHNTLFANGAGNISLGLTTQRNQLSIIGNQPLGTGVLSIHDVRSGSTLDNYKGFDVIRSIENLGTITNFYGYHVNVQAANEATNAWAFYNDANIPSYFKGYVGIGTNAPTRPVEIVRESTAEFGSGIMLTEYNAGSGNFGAQINLRTANGTKANPQPLENEDVIAGYVFDYFSPSGWTNGNGSKIMSNYVGDGTNRRNDLRFYTTQSTVSLQKMRLDPDGNLGIGVFAPQAKLHVVKAAADLTPAIIEGCPVFADNAAAASLPTGAIYRTSTGVLMVKY